MNDFTTDIGWSGEIGGIFNFFSVYRSFDLGILFDIRILISTGSFAPRASAGLRTTWGK
jgi:hypothetical protein